MKNKIKRSLVELYKFQGGFNWQELGRAIDWRINLLDKIRSIDFEQFTRIASGLIIRQQIETELDLYRQQLEELFTQAENGEITREEFQEKLEALTLAIFIIAFLSGSNNEDDPRFDLALQQLQDGAGEITLDDIDNDDVREQAEIAVESTEKLGDDIEAGLITLLALLSRSALWITTALGIYNLGILNREDDPFLIWLYSPLKDHCSDCRSLNGQIHTREEWDDFFRRTGKRPQGRALECGGWKCGCGVFESDGPSRGDFV